MGAGSTKIARGNRERPKLLSGARSKKNYQRARRKIKKEQGAKRKENGASKIGKKEQVLKNRRQQRARGKMF